jgi:hypothetical protein
VDLAVDRHGQLAFSRATGTALIDGAVTEPELLHSFLEALNSLIELTRDILSEYWIRTIAIKDCYYLKVEVDGAFVAQAHAGRGQGFTHAVIGLKPEADARLRAAIAGGQRPPVCGRSNLTHAMRWTSGATRTVSLSVGPRSRRLADERCQDLRTTRRSLPLAS